MMGIGQTLSNLYYKGCVQIYNNHMIEINISLALTFETGNIFF